MAFYGAVIGAPLTRDDNGPNPMAVFTAADMTSVAGHLYPGKPAADGQGPTIHLAIAGTVEDAMARCTKAGGTALGPIVTIPPGRFAYAQDLDGNSIGLFESA
jgi:predicted enzyme related to lactoylglutathione lyase